MSRDNTAPPLGRFDYRIIRKKIRQIVGRAGFSQQDREDLEQELITRLLQGLKSFNPVVGHRNAFATAIVERSVATLLRDARAAKRDPRRICSLNVMVEVMDESPIELADRIGEREYNARRGRDPRGHEELAQLIQAVADFLASLPIELQEMAEALKTGSVSAAARQLEVPRTTLASQVRRERQRFERSGLRDYL